MAIWSILVVCIFQAPVIYADEVCFFMAGCYSQREPWVSILRPFPPPQSPEKIQVRFYLFTRKTWNVIKDMDIYEVLLNPGFEPNLYSLKFLDFDANRPSTVFIIHGFASNVQKEWVSEMVSAYLYRVDANIIAVDWRKGANLLNYLQVAANTRVVAYIVSRFLWTLITKTQLNLLRVHFIGHSLGAHTMGYVGKNIPGIQRGTALDPAQPGFEGCSPKVRLHKNDFIFLDVIHTNGKPLGLGFITSLGDVDFYFNSGTLQPKCIAEALNIENLLTMQKLLMMPVEALLTYFGCSHRKSIYYFIEAIRRIDCIMWGHRKENLDSVLNLGKETIQKLMDSNEPTCNLNNCSPVGLETFLFPARGDFDVHTEFSDCVSDMKNTNIMVKLNQQFQPYL